MSNQKTTSPPAKVQGPRMLPGMAMLVISLMSVAQVLQVKDGRPSARYAVLTVCSLVIVGVYGFLRLRRWGWACVLGGTFFYSLFNTVLFFQTHQGGRLLPAAFSLVFFLYLVRTEVRDRLH